MIVCRCKIKIPSRTPLWCRYRYIHTDEDTPSEGLWFCPCNRRGNESDRYI